MKKSLLLLTDFSYQAKGRVYFQEDVELSQYLRRYFHVHICHIEDADRLLELADVILLRNTGPQSTHHRYLKDLRKRKDLCLFNDLQGKGDIDGKTHLKTLFEAGFPVIPSFTEAIELPYDRYLLKPLDGADSCGVKIVTQAELLQSSMDRMLIQPLLDFQYEVSFYFIGNEYQYALYTPNSQKRWELEFYNPTKEDLAFASRFIAWNTCRRGIQRVDACRLTNGELLLMELEDYNPFLSLDSLKQDVKDQFIESLCLSLKSAE